MNPLTPSHEHTPGHVAATDMSLRGDTPRIGLVLGAGGTVGAAYHAGVLYSIEHHLGIDPRDAVQIVGTSAGSLIGALLRAGVATDELVRLVRRDEVDVPEHLRGLHEATVIDVPGVVDIATALRLPTRSAVTSALRHRNPMPWLLSVTRGAPLDMRILLGELDDLFPDAWPANDLKVCAADAADGRRVVLDATSDVELSRAVAASCSVPGLFRPQKANGRRLVDGGVWSTTNVDALDFTSASSTIDEVWIIAPMGGSTFRRPGTSWLHRRIDARLRRELSSVPIGMPVRLFMPGRESSEVMGIDLMSEDRAAPTILAGFLEAGSCRRRDLDNRGGLVASRDGGEPHHEPVVVDGGGELGHAAPRDPEPATAQHGVGNGQMGGQLEGTGAWSRVAHRDDQAPWSRNPGPHTHWRVPVDDGIRDDLADGQLETTEDVAGQTGGGGHLDDRASGDCGSGVAQIEHGGAERLQAAACVLHVRSVEGPPPVPA